jgi:hypothetical protein
MFFGILHIHIKKIWGFNETPINYRNDIQLALIKTYATDIYDTDEDGED